MMKKLNKVDRPLLTSVPKIPKLSVAQLDAALMKGIKVIDTRLKTDFANGFIPGTINIQGNNAFGTWMGWFVTYDEPFILVADGSKLDDLTRKLMRIGLDNIYGYVANVNEWAEAGGKLLKSDVITTEQFKVIRKTDAQVIDLRGETEYTAGHAPGAEHVFIGKLENNLERISQDRQVVIYCQGGDRAAIGYSVLARQGFKNVKNYSGGINEWVGAGNEIVTDQTVITV
jgi:hydroxyacylglutathione hydrolase